MEFLINPNVAYLLMATGAILALMAVISPGTGLFELGAFFAFVLAGYSAYYIGINPWAMAIVVLAIVPFVLAVRRKAMRRLTLAISIGMVIGGSVFLFTQDNGWPAVNPILAITVSLLGSGLIWFSIEKSVHVLQTRPVHDLDALIGQIGEAKSAIHVEGAALVSGELWTARSQKKIPQGSSVRVTGRDGFILFVEQAE